SLAPPHFTSSGQGLTNKYSTPTLGIAGITGSGNMGNLLSAGLGLTPRHESWPLAGVVGTPRHQPTVCTGFSGPSCSGSSGSGIGLASPYLVRQQTNSGNL
ncbi:unnamed protein product, partial [Protopolystoma xenopodis]